MTIIFVAPGKAISVPPPSVFAAQPRVTPPPVPQTHKKGVVMKRSCLLGIAGAIPVVTLSVSFVALFASMALTPFAPEIARHIESVASIAGGIAFVDLLFVAGIYFLVSRLNR